MAKFHRTPCMALELAYGIAILLWRTGSVILANDPWERGQEIPSSTLANLFFVRLMVYIQPHPSTVALPLQTNEMLYLHFPYTPVTWPLLKCFINTHWA